MFIKVTQCDNSPMFIEQQVSLQPHNTFGIAARAQHLVRVRSAHDVRQVLASEWAGTPMFVLGGGSNIILTGDVRALVLKVENRGSRLIEEDARSWLIEAEAGENWHSFVKWTIEQGWPGLENMALIPGTVGASPVQNIGAYGVELQDRFESLDAIDLQTGREYVLRADQCAFGYRDSIFKHGPDSTRGASSTMGLAGRALILRVRFRLSKRWRPELDYQDLQRKVAENPGIETSPRQIFDWVCEVRRAKLPDPAVVGNAGSFFKNPTVTEEQCADIIGRDPKVVFYHLPDGRIKLAAGWLIDACGWKGKSIGHAGVYERQALVLVNRGGPDNPCTGGEVMTLAKAIQTSVYERFGILLEPEPVVV
ncbi:MAG: UDP-N-acetylenolpyruvoylglucosamine reductase [Pseudomonadota bacterium]